MVSLGDPIMHQTTGWKDVSFSLYSGYVDVVYSPPAFSLTRFQPAFFPPPASQRKSQVENHLASISSLFHRPTELYHRRGERKDTLRRCVGAMCGGGKTGNGKSFFKCIGARMPLCMYAWCVFTGVQEKTDCYCTTNCGKRFSVKYFLASLSVPVQTLADSGGGKTAKNKS